MTPNTKPGARGFIVPPASAPGNPSENELLPAPVQELQRLGLRPREVALDGGFQTRASTEELAPFARTFIAGSYFPPPTRSGLTGLRRAEPGYADQGQPGERGSSYGDGCRVRRVRALEGTVALVTGASRNAGRGIALVLGEAGATVYVTGRSGALEETVELVGARGGTAIAHRCDHTVDAEVDELFVRVREERGRLDLLVNNVWDGYVDMEGFLQPFWCQPTERWDRMFTAGVRAHFTASRAAAPLMIERGTGLMVSTTFWDRDRFFHPLPYWLSKTAINGMAFAMALELRPHGIAAIALSPGWIRTDRLLRRYATDDRGALEIPELGPTHSIEYLGRAVLALALDAAVLEKSGRTLTAGALAEEYGFTDVDGRVVPPFHLPD